MALIGVKKDGAGWVYPWLIHIHVAASKVAAELPAAMAPADGVIEITSGMDSTHGRKSQHYKLSALDFRTKDFPSLAAKHLFRDKLQAELGSEYQVILENLGTDNEHCHAEHDPP